MKNIPPALIILAMLLTACGSSSSASQQNRQATFTLIVNDIRARLGESAAFGPAGMGDQLVAGGQAQSGEDSRARLDLEPEGTIVRLGPNTLFTLEALNDDTENPLTRLNLLLGQIWIVLASGSLEVETPYGTGAVRGSYMSVAFDPLQGMIVTCLEGHCGLSNTAGTVALTGGQASSIPTEGQPPSAPRPLSTEEIGQWQEASPEADTLIQPDATDEPQFTQEGEPIPEKAEGKTNSQPLKFNLTNNCTDASLGPVGDWTWEFVRLADANGTGSTERFSIATGQTASVELPAGQYVITDWFANGEQHGPQIVNSDNAGPNVQSCPGPGSGPGGGSSGNPGGDSNGNAPGSSTYTLVNNCPSGDWHWQFNGPETITVDIPAGQTASGTLPAGTYTAVDWLDTGETHYTNAFPPGGNLSAQSCPGP